MSADGADEGRAVSTGGGSPAGGVYLDHAAFSFPKPAVVIRAVDAFLRQGASPGRGFSAASRYAQEIVDAARQEIADLLRAPHPSRVVFTANATDALNGAISGALRGGAPGRVLTTALEHNSVLRPLRACVRDGRCAGVDFLPLDEAFAVTPAALDAALTEDVRLVVVHHASNVLGSVQDVAALGRVCREHGVPLLVDAAQSVAVLDVDARAVDLIAFSGHKNLFGPGGVGVLYVGEGVDLPPWRTGGTGGHASDLPHQPAEPPHAWEAGTLNAAGIAGMLAGLRWVRERGAAAVRQHHFNLSRRLLAALVVHPNVTVYNAEPSVGIVSFNLQGWEPTEVARVLDESFGIGVGAGLSCAPEAHRFLGTWPSGAVRASVGLTTRESDVDALADAMERLAGVEVYGGANE